MGVIGRFAELSPSKFNPLSLDEIMAVPLYKQQQHDKLVADNESLYKSLIVDQLDVHKDEAERLKKDFENKLDAQALQLAKYGIDQNSKSEFLKTKREYDKLVSPTGRIGQINNAKKVYLDNFKEYIEDATKNKGWSREKALENWNNKFADKDHYKGYDENNNIVNIGNYGAPKKIEVNDKLKFAKDILGEQVINEARASGYKLIPQSDGSMVFADSKGRRIETSNKRNLQHALNLLNQQMQDPEWRSSIDFEGVNPESVRSQISSGINAMLSNKVVDNRTTDYAYHAKPKGDGKDDANFDLITNTEVFNPSAYAGKAYVNNQKDLIVLSTKPNLTFEENKKLNQLRDFQNEVNKNLNSNAEYRKLLNDRINVSKGLGINFDVDKVEKVVEAVDAGGMGTTKEVYYLNNKPMTSEQVSKYRNYIQKNNHVENKIDALRDKVTKENNVKYNGYQLVPTTAKENTSLKLMNEAFESAMRANPQNLLNFTNIESVDVDGKRKDNITSNDKLNIQELFNNTESGSARIVSFIPKGFSGKPEYVVEFNTKEGNSYNLDNKTLFGGIGNDDIGDGKPVRVKLSFNKSSGDVLKNINGYIQSYLSTKGKNGEGMQLAQSMALNALSGNRWKDLVSPDMNLDQIDPIVLQKLAKELTKYGFNGKSSEADAREAIRKLLKEKKNTTVYFE